jgi:hypothetical protein
MSRRRQLFREPRQPKNGRNQRGKRLVSVQPHIVFSQPIQEEQRTAAGWSMGELLNEGQQVPNPAPQPVRSEDL